MADEEPKFCPFKFKKKDEDREKKIEELKKKFNLQRVLQLIEKGDLTADDDEETVAAKIASLKAVEDLDAFQQNMDSQRENLAQDLQKLAGKEIDNKNLENEITALKDKDDGFEKKYQEYLERKAQLEQEENSQKKTEELAVLESQNKEIIRQHNQLEKIEQKTLDCKRAEFFASLPRETQVNLVEFAQSCGSNNQNSFKEAFDNLISESNNGFAPRRNENGTFENEHKFKFDTNKGLVRHEIHNLGGTDLNICIVNGEFSFLQNKDLSEEQLNALAQYCYKNGLEIEDYAALNGLKIKGTEDKLGDRLKMSTEKLHTQELNDLNEHDAEIKDEIAQNRERVRKEAGEKAVNETDGLPQSLDTRTGLMDTPEVFANDNEDFCQFIPNQEPIKMDRKAVTEKAKFRIGLAGFSDPSLYRITRHGNSTIISVYANEDDMRIDGEIDKKGKKVHSKQFSVELDFSTPPKPRFYMGNLKEFKCDHARLMLDPYKTAGYEYFIIPSPHEMGGKVAGGAFMEASVKTQMVPFLKRKKDGKGCEIGVPDIETIFKKMPEEGGLKGNVKVKYMMRWYRELKAYNNFKNSQGKLDSNLKLFETQFKVQANFVNFQASYLENMQKHIQKGMNGELEGGKKWDTVDQVTATKAMTKILKEMMDGKLNDKVYNPLANNEPELIQVLETYMKAERPKVEEQIDTNILTAAENDPKGLEGKVAPAVRTVQGNADQELRNICGELKGYGVEVDPKVPRSQEDYRRGSDRRSSSKEDDDEKVRLSMKASGGRS